VEAPFEKHAFGTAFGQSDILRSRLTYHEITTVTKAYRYSVSAERFKEHVAALQRFRGKTRYPPDITFDDGHISQIDNALPVLNSFGEKATFFITAGWTGKRRAYMNWNHLRELHACGHEVLSHGWSHIHLTECSLSELASELIRSKHMLEDQLSASVDGISMPGGRCNSRIISACAAAGYGRVFTSDPLENMLSEDGVQVMGRWMVTRNMRGSRIVTLVRSKGTVVELLKVRHRVKEFAKYLIGERVYRPLWHALSNKGQSLEEADQSYRSAEDRFQ